MQFCLNMFKVCQDIPQVRRDFSWTVNLNISTKISQERQINSSFLPGNICSFPWAGMSRPFRPETMQPSRRLKYFTYFLKLIFFVPPSKRAKLEPSPKISFFGRGFGCGKNFV